MKFKQLLLAVLLAVVCSCSQRQSGLAEYHEALELMDKGDAPAALRQLQRAFELAQTDSLRALVQSQMGTLYFSQRLLDRSLQSYRRAYLIDLAARDTVGLIYDLRYIGNVLRATVGADSRVTVGADSCVSPQQDSCLAYFEEARRLAIASHNLPMQRDVESQMAGYHLYRNHLDEARRLLLPAMRYVGDANQSGLLFMMADLYHREGQRDSATYYYRQLLQRGNLYTRQAAHRALAEYCLADGQTDEAMHHLRLYELLSDSVHRENDAEAMRRTSALYDYTLREQHAHLLGQRLTVAVAAVLLLAVSLVAILLYFSRRRMHYRLKVQRLEQLLENYRKTINSQTSTQPDEADAEPVGTGNLKSTLIFQKIERFLADAHQPAMGDDDFHLLADTIEQYYPGFLVRLQEFCHLTPQERRVCLLLKLDLTPAAIAQLTAHTHQSVTNTRSRLYKKAFGRQGAPADWDEFVRSLCPHR
jgi:tetratricopeptide (TPR) repeat protein